jgi:hypothetical protein
MAVQVYSSCRGPNGGASVEVSASDGKTVLHAQSVCWYVSGVSSPFQNDRHPREPVVIVISSSSLIRQSE